MVRAQPGGGWQVHESELMSEVVRPVELAAVDYDPFAEAPIARVVPTTEPQREVWLASQLSVEASLAYNESVSIRWTGAVDVAALQRALQDVVNRHEALRATVSADGQSLFLADAVTLEVALTDFGNEAPQAQAAAQARALAEAVAQPFDLEHGPLIRAALLKFGPTHHLLVISAHHIVCDGWSFGVLVNDLTTLYRQHTGRRGTPLRDADSFLSYALAQIGEEHSGQLEADTAYWVTLYDGSVPVLDLPTDRPRKPVRTFASRREDVVLDAALVTAVRRLGAERGASLFVTLFGMFAALLSRLSGAADVVVGVPAAGQAAEGARALVGHCVNLLPIRVAADLEDSFATLLGHTSGRVLDAYDHQHCTFGSLLKKLKVPRDAARLPLVSVLFNLDSSIDPEALRLEDATLELASNPRQFENFDLYLNASQLDGAVVLECQYNTDLFDVDTVQRWLALYRIGLERAVADPGAPMALVLAPTPADSSLLASFNGTGRPYEQHVRLGDLILRSTHAHADRCAVIFEGRNVSFGELERAAWGIAAALRERGAGPGVLVGVCLERSVEMVTALVGVLLSGAAYVPLDPTLPQARLSGMCEDADLRLVLTRNAEQARAGAAFGSRCSVVLLDEIGPGERASLAGSDDDPAYVIFTSGSTGRPKGAMNAHRGIVNRLLWMQEAYALEVDDRVLQKTPFTFDVSVWEFFWPLITGATLVVARPEGHRDGEYLTDLVQRERITVMHFVPSMLRLFLAEPGAPRCTTLRRVLCSGEALAYDLVEGVFEQLPAVRLANLYGPTEAAVDVTAWECRPRDPSGIVPIGAPVANTSMYVLDERMRALPLGVPGDLYIGGVQVGLGYVGRPELTAERFLADPFWSGGRIYKTGDIARWRADGAIEYLGRSDFQVKLRGYRIELGEIEAELLRHPEVGGTVVVTREDEPGDVRLVAYVVMQGATEPEALRNSLRSTLPDYMIPQHVVTMAAIPLLPSGKVDRRALPRPQAEAAAADQPRLAARTPIEHQVLAAMEQVLNLPGLGVQDDFFALGGHSLLAAKLTARLNKDLGIKLSLSAVFKTPTAQGLARAIETARQADAPTQQAIEHRGERTEAPLTVMQERIRFMVDLHPGRVVYNTPSAHRLTGPLHVPAFEEALRMMVQRQPSLRTVISRGSAASTQRVLAAMELQLPLEDLTGVGEAEREQELMRRLQAVIDEPIDIYQAPLFRVALFRMAPEQHVFLFMPHHIIWDGWSFDLLYQELAALYPAALHQHPVELPPPSVTYLDYAHWHSRWMQSQDCRTQVQFWKQRYAGIATLRALPTDRPRNAGMSGAGAVEWVRLDKPATERLRDVARQFDATLNMLVMAVYSAMLSEAIGNRSLVLGIPVRGRLISEVEPVMGFFNNLLPTPLTLDATLSFKDWTGVVKRELLDSFAHQEVPFERLASEPEIAVHANKAGLYQSLFSFQDARERERQWGPLAHESVLVMQKGATEDFGLWLMEVPGGLEGGINYNVDLFEASTARLLRDRLLALLQRVGDAPDLSVQALLASPGPDAERLTAWVQARQRDIAPPAPSRRRDAGIAKSAIEARLAAIWARLLGIDAVQIAADDNFFDLGGNSLLVMQAVAAAHAELGLRIEPGRFVHEPLSKLAADADQPLELARIWADLLGIDAAQIHASDNFFDLGGSSLLAMRAVAEMQRVLGLKIDPNRYVHETLQQLGRSAEPAGLAPDEPAPERSGLLSRVLGRFGRRA
jgi:amino acid adenylation domain-containing protein